MAEQGSRVASGLGPLRPMGSLTAILRPLLGKGAPLFLDAIKEIEDAGIIPDVMAMAEVAPVAGTALVTKLLRVFMLQPWLLALYYFGIGQKKEASGARGKSSVPWFAFGFIGVAAVNSIWGFPPAAQKLFTQLSAAFLATAMAALGLNTDLVKVKSLGWRPIALAMALWANLLGGGFVVARLLV